MYTLPSSTSRNREVAQIKSKDESFGRIEKANGSKKASTIQENEKGEPASQIREAKPQTRGGERESERYRERKRDL